ncbi:hypothetical protein BDA99DRAFT_601244 [Phascolomyces articulosus]|uniref:Uncharacterized protein n=1 Tax=Phascolomyces articulosus TaxID=60185 RepID=A0AAD5K9G2_9FUNG|nr:hypothetical protein BDA99DRAFT_601244 [Phascolomyces articulosus]
MVSFPSVHLPRKESSQSFEDVPAETSLPRLTTCKCHELPHGPLQFFMLPIYYLIRENARRIGLVHGSTWAMLLQNRVAGQSGGGGKVNDHEFAAASKTCH